MGKSTLLTFLFLLYLQLNVWKFAVAKINTKSTLEKEDDSVCFNDCSGHGTCKDYQCSCFHGFHGDDCRYSYAENLEEILPIMSQGHFNLTQKALQKEIKKQKFLVVGFSSYTCHKCITAEPEYKLLSEQLKEMEIPFARVDGDKAGTVMKSLPVVSLTWPLIVIYQRKKPYVYEGPQLAGWIVEYIGKLRAKKEYKDIQGIEQTMKFLAGPAENEEVAKNLTASSVVGFFSDPDSIEEDEMEDFLEASQHLQTKADIYFARVTDKETISHFKQKGWIDRTPSVLLSRGGEIGDDSFKSTNLDELYSEGDTESLVEWILQASIPLVGELTGRNFGVYEKLGKPILMMFLNLEGTVKNKLDSYVPGTSGNLSNNNLVTELREAAKDHFGRISFVYVDGVAQADRMKALGLFGGIERLPSIALNTKDGRKLPFPEILPINRDTLLQFCADYLSGRLLNEDDAKKMAERALMATNLNRKNIATRKERKKPPEEVKGVSEQWKKKDPVIEITPENFEDVVLNPDNDVVILFYAQECEICSNMTPYYKRMGLRFQDLEMDSVVVGRMDLTNDSPPPGILVADLPLIVMFPANDKNPPFRFYSGVSKVRQMMLWVEENAATNIKLPDLPHLNEEDRILYKEQVREREEYRAKKKAEDEQAMLAEQKRRQEYEKRKKEEVQKEAEELEKELDDFGYDEL